MVNILRIARVREGARSGRGRRARTTATTDDPHALLGVGRRASAREIRAAYLRLVKELHPDGRAFDPGASAADERLKAINAAYRELTGRGGRVAAGEAGRRSRPHRASTLFLVGVLTSAVPMLATLGAAAYYAGWLGPRQAPSRTAAVEEAARPARRNAASEHVKDPYIGRQAAWAEAETEATRDAWEGFIEAYPDGELAAQARQAIAAIDRKQARKAWSAAHEEGTKVALQRFLAAYPESRHAAEAKEELAAIARAGERRRRERTAWAAAQRSGSRQDLERFLVAYPKSGHAAEARKAIAAITEAQAQAAADLAAWTVADRDGGMAALRRYLSDFPSGGHAAEAEARVARLEVEAARAAELARTDDAAWRQARHSDNRAAYARYLTAHPDGRRAQEARVRLAELERRAAKAQPAKARRAAAIGRGDGTPDRVAGSASPPARPHAPVALAGPAADEGFFVGADGRIRR